MVRSARTAVRAVALISILGGCTAASAPSGSVDPAPSGSPPPVAARSDAPSSTPIASGSAAPEPSPTPEPTPEPTPKPTRVPEDAPWSEPVQVLSEQCGGLAATIDDRGRYHVAANCPDGIRYVRWYPGAIDSHGDRFAAPADRIDYGPQLAVDGRDVVMAFSRYDPGDADTCGPGDVDDVGVFTRRWSDDSGAWSKPSRLGEPGDSLQSFRAVDGTLHATVADEVGRVAYVSRSGDRETRIPLTDAFSTSLRVGDDRRARIAYSTGEAIRYARVDGDALTSTTVDASDRYSLADPALVLAPGDVPTLLWTRDNNMGGGCADVDPDPRNGTYLATREDGSWHVSRISPAIGPTALTLDPVTGRWHAVVVDSGLRYLTGVGVEDVAEVTLPGTDDVDEAIIRVDPRNGRVVIVASRGVQGVDLITKP